MILVNSCVRIIWQLSTRTNNINSLPFGKVVLICVCDHTSVRSDLHYERHVQKKIVPLLFDIRYIALDWKVHILNWEKNADNVEQNFSTFVWYHERHTWCKIVHLFRWEQVMLTWSSSASVWYHAYRTWSKILHYSAENNQCWYCGA